MDHIWLLAGLIWRTTFYGVEKQFYGVEKQNCHDKDATRRHLVTHLFQRKATHQKRYGRFRSFRLAAGLVGINPAAAALSHLQSLGNIERSATVSGHLD